MLIFVFVLFLSLISQAFSTGGVSIPWSGRTIGDLRNEYYQIFPHRNRNAASHRWATFLIERSGNMDKATFEHMFTGFCPVSGSPIGAPGPRTLYQMTVPLAKDVEQTITGGIHFCCWPCVCDTADFIRVDTKTVELRDGTYEFPFLVLGNPCAVDPSLIPMRAPDANCNGSELVKATMSDNGFVIIGLLQNLPSSRYQSDIQYADHCEQRARTGFQSGMGTIFREVAAINHIDDQQPSCCSSAAEDGHQNELSYQTYTD